MNVQKLGIYYEILKYNICFFSKDFNGDLKNNQ